MKHQSGFTLVELAVVVFLVGLLASVGLSALNAQMASAHYSTTKKNEDLIKDTLISYLGRNKRLPCPDSNVTAPDGIENRGATGTPSTAANTALACDKIFGIVPYQTLGLPKSAALDGWGNFFSYQVSNDTSATNLDWTLTNSFHAGNSGIITAKDRSSADRTNIVAVVVSYGHNGFGAYTSKGTRNVLPASASDEYQNTQASPASPPVFYNREYSENTSVTGGAFDDLVMTLNPTDLITPLMKDGAIKSPESQWSEQITNINSALIGAMFNNSNGNCEPPADLAAFITVLTDNGIPTVDPWGGVLAYTKGGFCRLHNDGLYKTSSCTSNCGTCFTPTSSMVAFTVATSTTTPALTIRPQTLNSIMTTNPSLLKVCPDS